MIKKEKDTFLDEIKSTNDSETNDMEEEDEIVREIDVFISPELAATLHLIQFPLQPSSSSSSTSSSSHRNKHEYDPNLTYPEVAKMKPGHSVLQLEYPYPRPVLQTSYTRPPSSFHPQSSQPKRIFDSYPVPIVTHMALGVFDVTGTALHLVPLSKVYQMRPSFDHLSTTLDNSKSQSSQQQTQSQQESTEETKLVFQRQESEKNITSRRSSYAHYQALKESEPWIYFQVIPKPISVQKNILKDPFGLIFSSSHRHHETSSHPNHPQEDTSTGLWQHILSQILGNKERQVYLSSTLSTHRTSTHMSETSMIRNRNKKDQDESVDLPIRPDISTSSTTLVHSNSSSNSNTFQRQQDATSSYIKTLNYLPNQSYNSQPSDQGTSHSHTNMIVEEFVVPSQQEHAHSYPTIKQDHSYNHPDHDPILIPSSSTTLSSSSDFILPSSLSSSIPTWKKDLTSIVTTLVQGRNVPGVPIPYHVLRARFPVPTSGVSDLDLLEAISSCAVLVRGNFLLKSSLLPCTQPQIQDLRNWILLLLQKYGYVRRDKLIQAWSETTTRKDAITDPNHTPPSTEEDSINDMTLTSTIHGILASIGRKTINGVEMKIDDDFTIETQFPHITTLHAQYWARKERKLIKYIQAYEALMFPHPT